MLILEHTIKTHPSGCILGISRTSAHGWATKKAFIKDVRSRNNQRIIPTDDGYSEISEDGHIKITVRMIEADTDDY